MEVHMVINHITKQSPDIAQGVNEGEGEDLNQGLDGAYVWICLQ